MYWGVAPPPPFPRKARLLQEQGDLSSGTLAPSPHGWGGVLGRDLQKRSPAWSGGWGRPGWGAGLTLPRTPYGPSRRSGCTAAAGPLDCSPPYRAPKRQEKAFGAGSLQPGAPPR